MASEAEDIQFENSFQFWILFIFLLNGPPMQPLKYIQTPWFANSKDLAAALTMDGMIRKCCWWAKFFEW